MSEEVGVASTSSGRLVICPTPIGNLSDMPPRALEALRAADAIYAEDTRVTGKLLAALDVQGKALERLDENVMAHKAGSVVAAVRAGKVVAYCTDAGMPGVSDPGLRLVAVAREAGVPVEVLPGPSAAATAYVASGTVCSQFYFGGFFPRKDSARRELLQRLAPLDAALVFYESPNRLVESLRVIADEMPERTMAVCRELTKLHEEVVRGLAPEVACEFAARDSIKGEVALVIDPASEGELRTLQAANAADATERACELLRSGARAKSVAAAIADEFGLSRNEAYNLVLSLRDGKLLPGADGSDAVALDGAASDSADAGATSPDAAVPDAGAADLRA